MNIDLPLSLMRIGLFRVSPDECPGRGAFDPVRQVDRGVSIMLWNSGLALGYPPKIIMGSAGMY